MNERIKELAVEADLLIKKSNGDEFRYGNFDPRFQKFAELIIKECEKVILAKLAVTDIDGEVERAWEMGMECGVYTIKEHFGVEA